MADRLLVKFEGLSKPIALFDSDEVYACFPKVFHGWRFSETETADSEPVITIRRDFLGYKIEADWLYPPLVRVDHVDALCGFLAELIRAFIDDNTHLLCLHGAAAEFGGRLVIFPNRYRAGKSVLSACLAAAGVRLFADDVLPIVDQTEHGMAPGIAPRLRVPPPDNLSADTQDFLDRRTVARGARYLYLGLPSDEFAPHGTTAPIGAFVVLERTADASPELLPIGESELLKQVIWQNFAREVEAPQIVRRLHGIIGRARSYRLRYSSADDAAAFLKANFTHWAETPSTAPVPAPKASRPLNSVGTVQGPPAGCYQRSPVITETLVDGESFLADAEGAAIHHLNSVGSAIWQALANPLTIGQIADLLHAAFPDADPNQIEKDVRALLDDLKARQLVLYGDDDGQLSSCR